MRHERVRGIDVEALLARALVAAARERGIAVSIDHHRSRPWASATFTGAQHTLTLAAADSPSFADWLISLPEAEFALRGHVVASLAIDRVDGGGALLAVLTLEDG